MNPRAPIFCFHDVVPESRLGDVPVTHRPYVLTPEELRLMLIEGVRCGRRAIPVGQVPGEMAGGFFSLTFDDGCASDYEQVFPVLQEMGLRATFFVVPTFVDTDGYVTWAQLREMVAAGMEIASHSMTHPFLHRCTPAQIRTEYGDSRRMLEDRLGRQVRAASLPRGWEPPGCDDILQELGYRVFCTSRVGWWHPGGRALRMPRVPIRRTVTVDEFGNIVTGAPRALWKMQAVDRMKDTVKRWIGSAGWQRLRSPLLALRYRLEERA